MSLENTEFWCESRENIEKLVHVYGILHEKMILV